MYNYITMRGAKNINYLKVISVEDMPLCLITFKTEIKYVLRRSQLSYALLIV